MKMTRMIIWMIILKLSLTESLTTIQIWILMKILDPEEVEVQANEVFVFKVRLL